METLTPKLTVSICPPEQKQIVNTYSINDDPFRRLEHLGHLLVRPDLLAA